MDADCQIYLFSFQHRKNVQMSLTSWFSWIKISHRFLLSPFPVHKWCVLSCEYTVHRINSITTRWPRGMEQTSLLQIFRTECMVCWYVFGATMKNLLLSIRRTVRISSTFRHIFYFRFHQRDKTCETRSRPVDFEATSFCYSFCWPPKSIDFGGKYNLELFLFISEM